VISDVTTVRWGHLDDRDARPLGALLSADELSRAAAFRFERARSRVVAARGLLRMVLGERLGLDPRRIEFSYSEHGKPRLAGDTGLRFNLSHSNGLIALALCDGREVGVDVEAKRDELWTTGIARRYLPAPAAREIERRTGAERAAEFFRAWVRQEAYVKGRGAGLELIGERPIGWSVADLELTDGYAGAVAIEGAAPVQVSSGSV
jgi:4'-phosphopantetheinyl transferase